MNHDQYNEKNLTTEQKIELMRAIANDDDARKAYIKSRAFVIEPLIAKENQIRNILTIENLAPGAQPQYFIGSKELQVVWLAAKLGNAPRRQAEGDEVFINTFDIIGRIEWHLDLARDARFPVSEQQTFNLANQLVEMENIIGWNMIKAAAADATFPAANLIEISSGTGVDLTTGKGYFSKQLLTNMLLAADKQRRTITDVYVSPRTMFDIFTYWGSQFTAATTTVVSNLPAGASEAIYNQGAPNSGSSDSEFTMNLWGIKFHKVYNSAVVGDDKIYAFDLSGKRSQFGVMPIRDTFKTYEDPLAITEFKVGIFGKERLGMAILDSTNMFVGTITRP